jgi:ribonuclease HI
MPTPVLLDGPICYTDASIAPDGKVQVPRKAGLGIFIHDPRRKLKLFIKVQAQGCSSVLVAEAVALSVASEITAKLDMNQINFLTDSQTLANFLNGSDLESPPKWRIKPYTQRFINATRGKSAKILKIDRNLNSTTHFLAAQAFRLSDQTTEGVIVVCKNPSHDSDQTTEL